MEFSKRAPHQNPKTPAEPVLTPHCRAVSEMLDKSLLSKILWCDNRDMIADPLTKGKTQRNILNKVLATAEWVVEHVMEFFPVRTTDLRSHPAQEDDSHDA